MVKKLLYSFVSIILYSIMAFLIGGSSALGIILLSKVIEMNIIAAPIALIVIVIMFAIFLRYLLNEIDKADECVHEDGLFW